MLFSSVVFLWVFLPAVLLLVKLPSVQWKNIVLLLASLLFYAWGGPSYLLLMLVSITLNYCCGLMIHAFAGFWRKMALAIAVILNLGLLGYYKYYTFAADTLHSFFGREVLPTAAIVLPIGISFYTFQAMSYVIDLYRGKISVQKNWFWLALYISLFPQLIAGPIVQYGVVERQLLDRTSSPAKTVYGIKRFLYGLGKKVVLSNALAVRVDEIYGLSLQEISTPLVWFAAVCYTFQLYYDFSGYSDMAIGLGAILGFDFPENFNYPFISASVSEFWRRWHMTLSGWFREYLYIPLGGNRCGKLRTLANLMVVFMATGLWHGANWQFVAWGIYFGVLLIAERLFLGEWLKKLPLWLGRAYTRLCVLVGFVLFRAPGLRAGVQMIKRMFLWFAGSGAYPLARYLNLRIVLILFVAALFCGVVQNRSKTLHAALYTQEQPGVLHSVGLLAIGFVCVMLMVAGTYNPFIYFRF